MTDVPPPMPTAPPPMPTAAPPLMPVPPQVIPYAAPVVYQQEAAWRDGDVLIVRHGTVLPPACIKCNAPAGDRSPMRRQLYWHDPMLYLLILAGVLVYALVALIVRKNGVVFIHLCPAHRQRRLMMVSSAWSLGLGGLFAVIFGASNDLPWLILAGLTMFVGGIIVALLSQLLRPTKIDTHFMWIKGCSPEFLAQFPPLPHH